MKHYIEYAPNASYTRWFWGDLNGPRREQESQQHPAVYHTLNVKNKTMMNIVAVLLVLSSVQAGLRSKAGNEQPQNMCILCTYLELEDNICFPSEQRPHGSKWNCDHHHEQEIDDDDLWSCLMNGTDSAFCTEASQGDCIWCAEPLYGLCVTPKVASKIRYIPYFNCDTTISETQ